VGVAEGQQHEVAQAVELAVDLGAVAAAVDHADPALHAAQLAGDLVEGFRRARRR
jgi:hypothetical protein